MNQASGESLQQQPFPLPGDLVDEHYVLVPCCGTFTSRLVQQEATITYLSVWLGNNQTVSFYAPPSTCCHWGLCLYGTLGERTSLPWLVNCFYIRGLDHNCQANQDIRRALDNINMQTCYLDNHPELDTHANDAQALDPSAGPAT
jgi:hypothetical protein